MLSWIIIFSLAGSLLSLSGGILLLLRQNLIHRLSLGLVSFAAGSLLAAAFLDLLPEAETEEKFFYALLGMIFFFLIEKLFIWYHCHHGECHGHPYTQMILLGDAIHNFIDGIIIAVSFLVNFSLGVITSIAVIAHEIPQEIGDFGVLSHGGMKRKNIILFNVLTALTTLLAALLTYHLAFYFKNSLPFLLAFAAGGFIYIAAADLIPEIHRERNWRKIIEQIIFMLLGILVIVLAKNWLGLE